MCFFPLERMPPERLEEVDYFLAPLKTDHVQLDYQAVMEDPAYLRAWSQSDWPRDEFTLEENLRDLEQHQAEHEVGQAFTYTILSKLEDRCLGCVYITPLGKRIASAHLPEDRRPLADECIADVCFWVRPSLHSIELDAQVLSSLLKWFETEWKFDHLYFHTSVKTPRQQDLLADAGLTLIAHFDAEEPRPGEWLLYARDKS